jgi:hypothetical protein
MHANDLQCTGFAGGFWPFGSLYSWCVNLRTGLFNLGF